MTKTILVRGRDAHIGRPKNDRCLGRLSKAQGDACFGSPIVLKEIDAGAALANCREARPAFCGKVLGQCLIGGRASVLSLSLPLLLSKGPHHARESVGRQKSPQLSVALTIPRLQILHHGSRYVLDRLSF